MIRMANVVTQLALGLWMGAMLGFGALTAPALFATVKSNTLAGAVAGMVVHRTDILGLVAIILTLICLLAVAAAGGFRKVLDGIRLGLTVVALLLVCTSIFYTSPALARLDQQRTQPIEQYALTDPLRTNYDRLHKLSVNFFSTNLFLAAALVALTAWRGNEQ